VWEAIRCPTLLLRGAESDLLSSVTARRMTETGPKPRLVAFEGVGHAPMLLTAEEVNAVVGFLREAPVRGTPLA
jgi:pimeloyl-ACP methyl ester carboxylesterase